MSRANYIICLFNGVIPIFLSFTDFEKGLNPVFLLWMAALPWLALAMYYYKEYLIEDYTKNAK